MHDAVESLDLGERKVKAGFASSRARRAFLRSTS